MRTTIKHILQEAPTTTPLVGEVFHWVGLDGLYYQMDSSGEITIINRIENRITNTYRIALNGGDYTSIAEAFTAINAMAVGSNIRLILDAGHWILTNTITIDSVANIYFEGSGVNTTFIDAGAGLTGLPMFNVVTGCNFTKMTFNGTTLTDYGTLDNEDCIVINNDQDVEIDNFKMSNFRKGINVIQNSSIFIFNYVIENCYKGIIIDSLFPVILDTEVGTLQNNGIGIDLNKSTSCIFDIHSIFFYPGVGNIGIKYNPTNLIVTDHPSITSCKWDNTGTFFTGFDFTRVDGRDANIVIQNNVGSEDKTPHCYINVTNNTTSQTLTSNIWTKLNFAPSSSYTSKFIIGVDNRITYQPTNRRDLMIWGSGAITTSTTQSILELAIVKNGNSATIYGIVSVTLDENSRKFQWSANAYLSDVQTNDYFEVWGRAVGANETIIFEDFNMLVKSM